MKFHLNQIPPEGLSVEGSDPATILELRDPTILPLSEVRYALDIGVSDGGLFATGSVGVELELECVACLERFRFPLEVPHFACQVELSGRETVDLTEPIREDILLALPPHPHCDWNGEKVCHRVALPSETAADPIPDEREVWGALDQLKLK